MELFDANSSVNVGNIRRASALHNPDRPIIVVTQDQELERLLGTHCLKVFHMMSRKDTERGSVFTVSVLLDDADQILTNAMPVGEMRQQAAMSMADELVVMTTDSDELRQLLGQRRLKVVHATGDSEKIAGKREHVFKFHVVLTND